MSQSLFLGFDGGATKTKGVALNPEKQIIAEGAGKSANFQIIGVEQASRNIVSVIELILKKVSADFSQIKTMYLGLAGAGRKDDAEKMRDGFIDFLEKKKYPVPKVQVESDAIAALEGAFGGKPGMILIGGTGSVLFAKEDSGEIHRVGGWGRSIGDEGSGYALGRSCLTAVAKEFDGRGKKTMMTRLLKEKKNIDSPQSLIAEVYQKNFDISSAAPIVIEAAEKEDGVALEIVMANADELIKHICAMLNKLKMPLPLVLIGSILSADNILSQSFRKKMVDKFPEMTIQNPEFPPAVGAALLAFKM
jgi:N-acetylglucosamine kinase-like BadF-type ATPase